MSTPVERPRPGTGIGCFGTGCVTLICLLVFLVIAFVGGGYWAWHHVQKTYSASEPIAFANATSSDSTISVEQSTALRQETPGDGGVATAAAQIEPRESAKAVQARWRAFENAADHHEKARIELSATDINTLIENDPKLRGKAAVSIHDNVGRVQVSIPLDGVLMMNGRYLNGEATIESPPDGNPDRTRISNIILAKQAVSDDMLDRRLFGSSSIRGYMKDWLNDKEVTYFRIENNRVIGETRGSR